MAQRVKLDATAPENAPGNWERVGTTSNRRYRNKVTGQTISRRAYDEDIGRLARAGIKSNEAQAKINREILGEEQLARPARGRTKLKETEPEKREELLKERAAKAKQKEQFEALQKKVRGDESRARRHRQINDRLLQTGRYSYRLNVPFEFEPIAEAVIDARGTHIVQYGVGVNGYDERNGNPLSAWIQLESLKIMRSIQIDFTEEDFETMVEWAEEHGYFVVSSAFVHFAWDRDYAKEKAEIALRKKRKQVFGNPVRGVGHGDKGVRRKATGG